MNAKNMGESRRKSPFLFIQAKIACVNLIYFLLILQQTIVSSFVKIYNIINNVLLL